MNDRRIGLNAISGSGQDQRSVVHSGDGVDRDISFKCSSLPSLAHDSTVHYRHSYEDSMGLRLKAFGGKTKR